MLLLTSVFCVVLSLELGVATPKGNRFKEFNLQNEDNKFNVERNAGDPTNLYNTPNNENGLIYPGKQRNVFVNNENYDNFANNNPAAFRNGYENQPSIISENKEYNQNNAERNFNNFNEDSPQSSYIASLPQVNRVQRFRPNDEVNNEANEPRTVDILSEVNSPNSNSAPVGSTQPIVQKKNHAKQIINKYNRQNLQMPEKINDKKEEEDTLSDVPEATPEYIRTLYNEDNQTKKNNVKSTITNLPRNNFGNKSFKQNSQNLNEATFQNPSAEILYERGQAKPYEISNEPPINSRQGYTNTNNILRDKQRLKNLYLSSKPTKHYMVVYPDGRVEQVDDLEKIQKVHRNYVMLNAKELLQHNPNAKNTASQESVEKKNFMTTTNTNTQETQVNSMKVTKDEQKEKVTQTVNELPDQNELPVATEAPDISTTEVTKTNNVVTSKDQLKEDEINDNQEKNKLNNNENTNSEPIVTTSDNSNNEVSTVSTTETPDTDDIVTTARSTIPTPATDPVILNNNNSPQTSNNTDNPNLPKEPEASNTPGNNLKNTKDDNVLADENTTPTPQLESNKDDESGNKTTTNTSDPNTVKENNNRIETINVNNETISNSSSLYSSVNSKESNSTTKLNNDTVITSEDGTDSDGNKFHIETIVTNSTNESSAQNLESNNVTSSDSTTVVTNSNTTKVENSPTENTQNNDPQNVTSSDSLKKKDDTDTKTIQIISNDTNSEVNENKKDDNNSKPSTNNSSDLIYTNASSSNSTNESNDVKNVQEESNSNTTSTNIKQDGSKPTNDDTDDSEDTKNSDVPKEKDDTARDLSNDNAVPSNDEDSTTPDTASDDLYYLNSPQKGTDDDGDATDTNDNLDTESPSSDETTVKESAFWFKANESFWDKLMNSNDRNSFYFLFPRPQPNTKETRKIIYPNGTVVVETTELVDNGDGENNSTKTVYTCGNCTTCDKTS